MKESIILMSFSALLLASSGIHSQATDKIKTTGENHALATQASAFVTKESSTKSKLILAKVNNIEDQLSARLDHSKNRNKVSITTTVAPIAVPIVAPTVSSTATPIKTHINTIVPAAVTKVFSDEEIAHLRQLFLQAENAIKKKNETTYLKLAEQLKDYPLYPYLQYQWLKKHLDREQQVKDFLQQQHASRYARLLKNKWLHYLGKRKQWSLLLENKTQSKNTTLSCYFLRAEIQKGDKQTALIEAKKLWAVGRSQPRACDPLFSQLQKSEFFTQELLWQRFEAALHNNKVGLASYVMNLMTKKYQTSAQLWINLHRKPSRHMAQLLKRTPSELNAKMFIHAINRLARKDISSAIELWDKNKQRFISTNNIANKSAVDKIERRLALKLVFEREAGAFERLGQLDQPNNSSRTWRVRVALSEQNWPNVLTAIHALSTEEKANERWEYWLARAYMQTGEIAMAQALYNDLANKRSFYGFLAADKVNRVYQLSNTPVDVSAEDISELKTRKEFRVAFELMILDRKNQAKLQWWHASRTLNKKEILVAAKLAQKWQWNEIAIFTIAKAKYWDDIDVRFPLNYVDNIHQNSLQHNLNPVILYGLIRRESAFNEKAHSATGARGLMQIMPRTGKYIAKHLNERWRGSNSLYNPVTNIKYGAYYYQKLLTQFDGHYAIALAAYNAGPHRVKKWLPESKTLPADIWIETIPYKETREYVTNVLAYALIYQQHAQADNRPINETANKRLSMNDFTRDITPLLSSVQQASR